MISFEPSEDQRLIRETISEFAKAKLFDEARRAEGEGGWSDGVRSALAELSPGAAPIPEELGGQGLGLRTAVLVNAELAYGDPSAPFAAPGMGPHTFLVLELAAPELARELLAPVTEGADGAGALAWSERAAVRDRPGFATVARARGDSFELDGEKCFVSGAARASELVVVAQVEPEAGWSGLGAFRVAADAAGVKVGERHATLGLDAVDFAPVSFDGVKVPGDARLGGRDGFVPACVRAFAKYSLTVAARQVGLARRAFEVAREYCEVRTAFGKPIGHFQAVAFTLADRHMDAESGAELCQRAAWAWDTGQDEAFALRATAHAVAHAHEAAMRCADDAVQLHGGAGFMRDVVVEKLMRDAKQLALCGYTAEQMDQIAAALAVEAQPEPALLLPTPETQAIFT